MAPCRPACVRPSRPRSRTRPSRRSTGDVEAVHRSRVASRRLREILPVLGLADEGPRRPQAVARGKTRRRVTRALGGVRELDVALGMLDEIVGGHPEPDGGGRRRRGRSSRRTAGCAATQMHDELTTAEADKLHRRPRRRSTDHVGTAATVRSARPEPADRRAGRTAGGGDRRRPARCTPSTGFTRSASPRSSCATRSSSSRSSAACRRAGSSTRLRRLQDLLGRQHDLEVVAGYVRAPGRAGPGRCGRRRAGALPCSNARFRELHAAYLAGVHRLVAGRASAAARSIGGWRTARRAAPRRE